jgi:hypothetical protein
MPTKKVRFTTTERRNVINKSSYEKNKDNYQTPTEKAASMREHYRELVDEDPEHFDKKERERKEHVQKTMAKLEKYGYMAEERPDGKFNICSLETAGKCIVVASLGYAVLRGLGLFKGGMSSATRSVATKRTKRKTNQRKTRKRF